LARFFEELFRPSQYQETPLLRGFYFSSGAQVGSPVDRVLAAGLGGGGGPPRHTAQRTQFEQPAGGSASFFVTDLLRKIIFPDRRLRPAAKPSTQRHPRKQCVIGAAVLVRTALIVIPAATSYLDNVELIDQTALDAQAARLPPGESLGGDAALAALDRLLLRLQSLRVASEQARTSYW